MSDQDRISPYNIKTISSRQVMSKEKSYLGDCELIQHQILQTNIRRTIWQTVRRITNEILGVEGLKLRHLYCCFVHYVDTNEFNFHVSKYKKMFS